MMDKKGFTLIEVLAVIVIIGVIAVITVPVIKDSLDDAKLNVAKDSAYGYKRAVEKYYFDKSMNNLNGNSNGVYTVNSSGNLVKTGIDPIVIDVSGKKPSGGFLSISENEVVSGCLQIGNYAVSISNGEISTAIKDNCSNN